MSRSEAKSIDRLPQEIQLQILSKLPVSSLMLCKCVSRAWKTLISDPYFPRLITDPSPGIIFYTKSVLEDRLFWLDLSSLPRPDPLQVKPIPIPPFLSCFTLESSCNGLLCFRDYSRGNDLHVYNPFSGSHLELPRSTWDKTAMIPIIAIGFLPITREFKILRIMPTQGQESDIEILTIGTDSWRYLGLFGYEFPRKLIPPSIDGNLHWINHGSATETLIAFNLEIEEFREFRIPDFEANNKFWIVSVLAFRGKLCLIVAGIDEVWRLWAMEEYGVRDSWREVLRFEINGLNLNIIKHVKVLCVLKDSELVLECYRINSLFVYDPKCGRFKRFRVNVGGDNNLCWIRAMIHMHSFSCIL